MALMEGDTNCRSRRRLTAARLREGVAALSVADKDLATVVARFGAPPLWSRRPGYATLVQIILEQQVSLTSAQATYNRLLQKFVEITPDRFAHLTEPQVRGAGITHQKAGYCLGIARQIADGTLDLRRIARSDDPTAHQQLVNIRGIGPWTAGIYLLMALGRPNIWPDGDLALASAAQQIKHLRQRPDIPQLRRLAQRWVPWRAVAARILWHHYLSTRGGSPVQE